MAKLIVKNGAIVSEQKPSLGRIVLYRVQSNDPPHNGSEFLPAVVVRVWSDDMLNLKVLNDGNEDFWRTSSHRGDDAGQWNWPPRV